MNAIHLPLRQSHPSLFRSLLIKAIFTLLIGTVLTFGGAYYIAEPNLVNGSHTIPLEVWGVILMISALMLFWGISDGVGRYGWAKRGLLTGSCVAGLFAVAYVFALFQGQTDRLLSPMFWGFLSLTLAVWVPEPAFNPVSSALLSKQGRGD